MHKPVTAESVQAQIALVGADIELARAANVAAALNAQILGTGASYAGLPFEAEPADFLRASEEAAP